MRIALIGANGQLGSDLREALLGEVVPLTRAELDLSHSPEISRALDGIRPQVVVNAAAYNLVDQAEAEPEAAFRINAQAPRMMAQWCEANGAFLVHYSTDYVFTGDTESPSLRPGGWTERDCPQPASVYAVTKLAGEQFVAAECPRHLILRTCGLYGRHQASAKKNFVETMLKLGAASEGRPLRVTSDHRCTPTSSVDLARATMELILRRATGLFHVTNAGATSWHEFAVEVFRLAGMTVTVEAAPSARGAGKARRPRDSYLNGERLQAALGKPQRAWQEALATYLQTREP